MSICIIGAGIAGLTAAIKLKISNPSNQILIIDSRNSNSQIAGQRYRSRGKILGMDGTSDLLATMAENNGGRTTPEMEVFASTINEELNYWLKLNPKELGINLSYLNSQDNAEWFGPKLGLAATSKTNSHGADVIWWFRNLAEGLGISILQGTVTDLQLDSESIRGVYTTIKDRGVYSNAIIYSDIFMFAGGNPGGRMFHSTNKSIRSTPIELLWKHGVSLVDSGIIMWHPFGRSTSTRNRKVGCFETDTLAGSQVFLYNQARNCYDLYDADTSALLNKHEAHYHFDEISQRFFEHGGTVKIVSPDNNELYASLSHHYSHIAVSTESLVKVKGIGNAFAIGDTAGVGRYTNNKIRLPGVALSACLVDAEMVCRELASSQVGEAIRIEPTQTVYTKQRIDAQKEQQIIRDINTSAAISAIYGHDTSTNHFKAWRKSLVQQTLHTREESLIELSLLTSLAVETQCKLAQEYNEPFIMCREELYNSLIPELGETELRLRY